jgi:CBS domain containing-hemolysin-like protein
LAWEITAVLACIVLSAFFSAAETALTSLGPIKTQRLLEGGEARNRQLKLWAQKPLEVLTCILIGNNIVNITASTLAAELADTMLSQTPYAESAIPVAIGVMTFLVLTFGEITPKTIAKAKHERLAGLFMWALWLPFHIFYPATMLFSLLTRGMMKLGGGDLDVETRVTEEDIEFLVQMGRQHGGLEDEKERLLLSVFDYSDTVVRECMVPRVEIVAVDMEWDLKRVMSTLIESGHSRVPVYNGSVDQIEGLFYAKDLLKVFQQDKEGSFDIHEQLREVDYVPEQMKISDLLAHFQTRRVHLAIVVDEFGGTSGLITLENIVEEFFGDIRDEYDQNETDDLEEVEGGALRAAGRTAIDDLATRFSVTFPENPDYDSLGGFIVSQLGHLPDEGDEVRYQHLCMRVTQADERRVIEVMITEDPDCAPEDAQDEAARGEERVAV